MDGSKQIAIIKDMQSTGLVPVFNHTDIEVVKRVLDACYKGGVRVFEFTNRSSNAASVFEHLKTYAGQFEDLYLGIGTVFTVHSTKEFLDLGADFVVSPAMIPEMGAYCLKNRIMWIPGCGSVTEIYNAKELGAKLVKIFPGNVLGPGFVKSVRAIFPDLALMPTGGVAAVEENLKAWFEAGVTCVGMGSKLILPEVLQNGNFKLLEQQVRDVIEIIKFIRSERSD